MSREQTIQVMIKRKIANDQQRRLIRFGCRADTQGSRNQAINAVGTAIPHETNTSLAGPEKGVQVTHRHAIANDESRPCGEQSCQFCKDSPFKRFSEMLHRIEERTLCSLVN